MPKYLTTEDWITRFREAHGDRYDYSKVVTKDKADPVTIVCPTHGEIRKTPDAHGREAKPCDGCVRDTVIAERGKEFLAKSTAYPSDEAVTLAIKEVNFALRNQSSE